MSVRKILLSEYDEQMLSVRVKVCVLTKYRRTHPVDNSSVAVELNVCSEFCRGGARRRKATTHR